MAWKDEQHFEKDWWDRCLNTFGEEEKQLTYAEKMGLIFSHDGKSPYAIDMQGKSVLDMGGGPISLLLKCNNFGIGAVIDPCEYPKWVEKRYKEAVITYLRERGETLCLPGIVFDEVWIYNVLQHVDDVDLVIKNALRKARIVRVFEWIENGISEGHPNDLTKAWLDKGFGGDGQVEILNQPTLKGKCYYGIFKGKHYGK